MKTYFLKLLNLSIILVLVLICSCNDTVNTELNSGIYVFPNPMSSYGQITYYLKSESQITLYISDNYGREVMKLVDNKVQINQHNVYIDSRKLPSGAYNCVAIIADHVYIKAFTVMH